MSAQDVSPTIRTKDLFRSIDVGFINRRLCLTTLPADARNRYAANVVPGDHHHIRVINDLLLVTKLLDYCDFINAPTLVQALEAAQARSLFRSTELFAACPDVYAAPRVQQTVLPSLDFGKPVYAVYHTNHLVSDTGRMILAQGTDDGLGESIIGVLHNKTSHFEIEPLVIGAPWLDHPRNGDNLADLQCLGYDFGEILPEDIEQFSQMQSVKVQDPNEWMSIMSRLPEREIKQRFATLLGEPTKRDWGGEFNDHFSANVTIGGQRKTGAFLFKRPADFREMTLDMCGTRADQIYRLANSGAGVSIVQHCHLIGEVVRATLRNMVIYPGGQSRKYGFIDGQATYRILKAYSLV
jgi:hypothetical protein